jgi:hypothetical protein
MLMDSKLIDVFWTHAMHTKFHIQNIVMLRNNSEITPYEIWKGRPTNVKHFRVFGRKFYIKREDGRMGNFDSHVHKCILVGYSSTRKAYKCYNIRIKKVLESINVTVGETGGRKLNEEEKELVEHVYEEETKDEEATEEEDEEYQIELEEKNNKYLQRHLANKSRRIIYQIRLLGTKMQELRLEEEIVHQKNYT